MYSKTGVCTFFSLLFEDRARQQALKAHEISLDQAFVNKILKIIRKQKKNEQQLSIHKSNIRAKKKIKKREMFCT